jgi:hypothetical protein
MYYKEYIPCWLQPFIQQNQIIELSTYLINIPVVLRINSINGEISSFLVKAEGTDTFIDLSLFLQRAACNIPVTQAQIESAVDVLGSV